MSLVGSLTHYFLSTVMPLLIEIRCSRLALSAMEQTSGLTNATPDWVWTASLTKLVQCCQTLFLYLESLQVGLKFKRYLNEF
jgi:hypothetical protein